MISKDTIDRIFNTVRIEEVVGDFVPLKKRCEPARTFAPFTMKNSCFNVNPVRNIYLTFTGKAAMPWTSSWAPIPQLSPEAPVIRKNIDRDWKEFFPIRRKNWCVTKRKFIRHQYICPKTFPNHCSILKKVDPSVCSYFKERGFTEDTIRKFQLEHSSMNGVHLQISLWKNGYKEEFLRNRHDYKWCRKNTTGSCGRVMFPDSQTWVEEEMWFWWSCKERWKVCQKYVNSPESEIHQQESVIIRNLLRQKPIVQRDTCYL